MDARAKRCAVWLLAALVLAALPSLAGCKGSKEKTEPAVDHAASQERLNVISNPSMYLDTGAFDFDNDATDYEQLLAMTVWNKSPFAVRGLEGDVNWFDEEGRRLGSSRFALTGSVPAHGSRTFSTADGSMTSGTLSGGALTVGIAFTHVNVDE
jgi:hypothetical protein